MIFIVAWLWVRIHGLVPRSPQPHSGEAQATAAFGTTDYLYIFCRRLQRHFLYKYSTYLGIQTWRKPKTLALPCLALFIVFLPSRPFALKA